ncbi:MAG: hypothetical protein SFU98_07300 [Leptospiraceae bacterium]|nr:hypothetical protein [Leptospiraceae bacterium]
MKRKKKPKQTTKPKRRKTSKVRVSLSHPDAKGFKPEAPKKKPRKGSTLETKIKWLQNEKARIQRNTVALREYIKAKRETRAINKELYGKE